MQLLQTGRVHQQKQFESIGPQPIPTAMLPYRPGLRGHRTPWVSDFWLSNSGIQWPDVFSMIKVSPVLLRTDLNACGVCSLSKSVHLKEQTKRLFPKQPWTKSRSWNLSLTANKYWQSPPTFLNDFSLGYLRGVPCILLLTPLGI